VRILPCFLAFVWGLGFKICANGQPRPARLSGPNQTQLDLEPSQVCRVMLDFGSFSSCPPRQLIPVPGAPNAS
jgi:hypothetical protein